MFIILRLKVVMEIHRVSSGTHVLLSSTSLVMLIAMFIERLCWNAEGGVVFRPFANRPCCWLHEK